MAVIDKVRPAPERRLPYGWWLAPATILGFVFWAATGCAVLRAFS